MKINALYLTVFTAYKIDHLINETGINISMGQNNQLLRYLFYNFRYKDVACVDNAEA
ncbi:hypothetical protein GCM10025767_30270 [Thalassotalea piscium]